VVVIQQVIVMSSQTLAQSEKAAGPPGEAEYDAVHAAVTATERGRWFLKEFANRNRSADTDLILAAMARIEAAIAGGAVPQAARARDLTHDLAGDLTRDAGDLAPAAAVIAPVRAAAGERDDDAAAVSAQVSPATDSVAQPQVQSDEDYSEAVAAIAASLTVRLEESAKDLDPGLGPDLAPEGAIQQSVSQDDAAGEAVRVPRAPTVPAASEIARPQMTAARSRTVQDNAMRWHIEGPDFVFGMGDGDEGTGAAAAAPSLQMHAQLLGAELMGQQQVETPLRAAVELPPVAAVAESAPAVNPVVAAVLDPLPVPAVTATPTAEAASPLAVPVLDIVPPSEISRSQLRIAREAMPANQRPLRYGSLTVSDALSEDEVIALFG
jgi:hypothetical protein